MSDPDARALLVEALDFFNDHPRFSLRRDRRHDSYALASRIDAFLARDVTILPAAAAAREGREATSVLRIDSCEQAIERDGDGYWVRAWVRVSPTANGDICAGQAERYARALDVLPEVTREVFLAHQRDEQDFATIAARLGLTTREVEQHVADALLAIGRALDRP